MKKIALVAYTGELVCFSHVMLYAIDFDHKGYEVAVVVEGAATALLKELADPDAPFGKLYRELCERRLIYCVCQACAKKMGVHDEVVKQGLTMGHDLQGHPSLEPLFKDGYELVTF